MDETARVLVTSNFKTPQNPPGMKGNVFVQDGNIWRAAVLIIADQHVWSLQTVAALWGDER